MKVRAQITGWHLATVNAVAFVDNLAGASGLFPFETDEGMAANAAVINIMTLAFEGAGIHTVHPSRIN